MKTERLLGVQWLRVLAASLVVIDHCIFTLIDKAGLDPSLTAFAVFMGDFGVKVFFAISGLVMVHTNWESFGKGRSSNFVLKRLIRIVPMYWAMTLIYAAKQVAVGVPITPTQLLESLLFIPYVNSAGLVQPIYGLGWSLNYEVYFYAWFALALLLPRRVGLFAVLALLSLSPLLSVAEPAPLAFWTKPMLLYFVAGAVIGVARMQFRSQLSLVQLPLWTVIVASSAITWAIMAASVSAEIRLLPGLVAASALLMLSTMGRAETGWIASLAALLGDASYSLYLTHSFAIGPLARVLAVAGVAKPLVFIPAALVLAAILAIVCHRYFEKPIVRALTARLESNRTAIATTAQS